MRLVWTEPAIRDLAAARAYIALDRPAAAKQQIELILTTIEILRRFPESGRPGRVEGIRELVVGRTAYIVAYRSRGETVEVLRVLHGRQRWPDSF